MTDEFPIKIFKSKEGSYLLHSCGHWPVNNSFKVCLLHLDMILSYHHSKVLHFFSIKNTFIKVEEEVEVVVLQFLEDSSGIDL